MKMHIVWKSILFKMSFQISSGIHIRFITKHIRKKCLTHSIALGSTYLFLTEFIFTRVRQIMERICHISFNTNWTLQDYRYYIHGRYLDGCYSLISTLTPTMTLHATSTDPIHLHFLPIPNVKECVSHTLFFAKNF